MAGTRKVPERQQNKYFISVEPVLLVNAIGVSMSVNILTDLAIRQSCASFGFEVAECLRNASLEDASQRTAATINAILPSITMLPPVLLVTLVGPWSEENGRKPFLIISTLGQLVLWASLGVESAIVSLSPYLLIAAYILPAITGGAIVVTTLCYCYLADISTDQNKTLRLTFGASCSILGNCLAPIISGWLISDGSYFQYIAAYAANVLLEVAILVYVIFFLDEPISSERKIKWNLFQAKHFVGMYRVMRDKRPRDDQLLILLAFVLIFISALFQFGEVFMLFLCVKKAFKWTIESYAIFSAIHKAATCLFTCFGVWFFCSYLKMTDLLLCALALAVYLGSTVLFVLTTTPALFYVASIMASINHVPTVLSKAVIAKTVSRSEVGSAMALCSILENALASIASPIYASFYAVVESEAPFSVFYLSMAFCVFGLVNLGLMFLIRRCKNRASSFV